MYHAINKKIKDRALHRAKILRGQFDGLVKAIEKEEYCPTLLEQSLSIIRSLKSLDTLILENHLLSHVKDQMRSKDGEEKAIKELIRIYTLSNK
jgi:DNA-binding FrmR family transcriptional regulator